MDTRIAWVTRSYCDGGWQYTFTEQAEGPEIPYLPRRDTPSSLRVTNDSHHLRHSPQQAYYHAYLLDWLSTPIYTPRALRGVSGKVEHTISRDSKGRYVFVNEDRRNIWPRSFRAFLYRQTAVEFVDAAGQLVGRAWRVPMSAKNEAQYADSKYRPDWQKGPRPFRLDFSDHSQLERLNCAGKSQYFPSGRFLRRALDSLLKLVNSTVDRLESKVVKPGYNFRGEYCPRTAQLESGELTWTYQVCETEGTHRNRIVRVLNLSEEELQTFLGEFLLIEQVGTAVAATARAVREFTRENSWRLDAGEYQTVIDHALGILGGEGLMRAVHRYDPSHESCKGEAVPFCEFGYGYAYMAAKHYLWRCCTVSVFWGVERYRSQESLEFGAPPVDSETAMADYSCWLRAQQHKIELEVESPTKEQLLDLLPTSVIDVRDFVERYAQEAWFYTPGEDEGWEEDTDERFDTGRYLPGASQCAQPLGELL